MGVDAKTLAASKKYTKETVEGAGAIKGKNCTIDSIVPITGGNRVTFKWTLDNGTVQTSYIDVMDGADGAPGTPGTPGADGLGIKSVDIDSNNHLIVTYDDDTTKDAGEIPGGGQTIQVTTMPTASATEEDKIYQYVGPTDATYTNGYFYKCVLDGLVYKWEIVPVQPGASGVIDQNLDPTSHNAVENMAIAVPMAALQGSMADAKSDIDNIKLDVNQLKASDIDLKNAVHNLDLLMASKVDKVAGKGLSTNDYTDDDLAKLRAMLEIQTVGTGLSFNPITKELEATGAAITIDPTLDPTSAHAIQNQAVAIPIAALQGSMGNVRLDIQQLQGSMVGVVKDPNYVHTDNNYDDTDKAAVQQIPLDISALQGSMVNVKLDIDQLQASMANAVIDPNYVHTDNNYDDTDKAAVQQIPLDIDQLQGSVLAIKLDVDMLSGSMALKADKVELDEFTADSIVNASGEVYFDNLDDSLGYKLCGWDRLVRIERMNKTDPDPLHPGKVALTFKTDAPQNTKCALRILK